MPQDTTKFRNRSKKAPGKLPNISPPLSEEEMNHSVATRHRKRRMVAAMKEHLGVVAYAAEAAGIPTRTHYFWMRTDEDYADQIMEAEDRMIGFTERKLLELVKAGDREACKFVLDRRGARHGWSQRVTVGGDPENPITIQHNIDVKFLEEEAPIDGLQQIVSLLASLGVPALQEKPPIDVEAVAIEDRRDPAYEGENN